MKHGSISRTNYLPPKTFRLYLKDLFKGLFRTTYSYPKTIWYSLRYNAGEKFLLNSPYLYPYKYNSNYQMNVNQDPVELSNGLTNSIENFLMFNIEKANLKAEASFSHEESIKTFNESLYELYKSYEYNTTNSKFDPPVAIAARTLYGISYFKLINHKKNATSEIKFSDFKNETINFIIESFMKKIDYADAECVSQVMHYLSIAENFDGKVWNKLIEKLNTCSFEPEFTKVKSSFPLFFRYEEVKKNEIEYFELSKQGNELFTQGFKSVFQTYSALMIANERGVSEAGVMMAQLEAKFPTLSTNLVTI